MTAHELLLVGAGGAVGTLGRYGALEVFPVAAGAFPTTTLVVNLVASVALGLLLAVLERAPRVRLLLVPGIVGGFGTLSLVVVESALLIDDGEATTAATYLTCTVLGGIALVAAGLQAGRWSRWPTAMPEEDIL